MRRSRRYKPEGGGPESRAVQAPQKQRPAVSGRVQVTLASPGERGGGLQA